MLNSTKWKNHCSACILRFCMFATFNISPAASGSNETKTTGRLRLWHHTRRFGKIDQRVSSKLCVTFFCDNVVEVLKWTKLSSAYTEKTEITCRIDLHLTQTEMRLPSIHDHIYITSLHPITRVTDRRTFWKTRNHRTSRERERETRKIYNSSKQSVNKSVISFHLIFTWRYCFHCFPVSFRCESLLCWFVRDSSV